MSYIDCGDTYHSDEIWYVIKCGDRGYIKIGIDSVRVITDLDHATIFSDQNDALSWSRDCDTIERLILPLF
jgi:hypothetical protein